MKKELDQNHSWISFTFLINVVSRCFTDIQRLTWTDLVWTCLTGTNLTRARLA